MKKLLVVCGPTATGKTNLALKLAKKFEGELINADSRQVYQGLDIGTGKDVPLGPKYQKSKIKFQGQKLGFWKTKDNVKIWGYDLVGPRKEFSVGQYVPLARKIIDGVWQRGKLPVLVGGTGLYLKGVINGVETTGVPKNRQLRKNLENKGAEELFEILRAEDPTKAAAMNKSDRKNPRRLIRAIEIAKNKSRIRKSDSWGKDLDPLFIGLKLRKKVLTQRIEARIEERLKQGFEKEVVGLLKKGVKAKDQAMQALGYRQYLDYYQDKDRTTFISKWKLEEEKYAKRQMTWFKKNRRIKWFWASNPKLQKKVEKLVKNWLNISNAEEN